MTKFIQHAGYNTKVCSTNFKFKPAFSAIKRTGTPEIDNIIEDVE